MISLRAILDRVFGIFLAICMIGPVLLSARQAAETGLRMEWEAKYIVGYEFKAKPTTWGTKLKVTIGPDEIVAYTKKKNEIVFSFPPASVTQVAVTEGPARAAVGDLGCSGIGDCLAAIFLEPLAEDYGAEDQIPFVKINWRQEGTDKAATLELKKGQSESFLRELENVTGVNTVDWPEIFWKLERAMGQKIPIRFDRMVIVNETELKPGLYDLILLEHEADEGTLHIYRRLRLQPDVLAVSTHVHVVEPAGSESVGAEVVYQGADDPATIAEIRLPGKTIRPWVAPPIEAHKVFFERNPGIFYKGKFAIAFFHIPDWVALVTQQDYEGEPSIRFPVKHKHGSTSSRHGPKNCQGFLYVTPSRLVFDPVYSPEYQRDAFNLLRSEVIKIKGNRIEHTVIKTNSRGEKKSLKVSFRFEPLFQRGDKRRGVGRHKRFRRLFLKAVNDFDKVVVKFQLLQARSVEP